jgi:TRAP-type mannitol/chloroaromatic compound transport system substrate-binding protein
MKNENRRNFLKKSSIALASTTAGLSALASACTSPSQDFKKNANATSTKKYKWIMVTTWPPKFPVLGEGLDMMAKWVETASAGRMHIKVMGAGELVPALECFDAVSQGGVQMASGVAYYWAGKVPAAQFFGAIPFGMNAQQGMSWINHGGGLKLWEDLYAPYNLIPMVGGSTGVQMGGWFRQEINSMADLQGLKIRMPGLGGKVMTKAGSVAVLSPGSELYTNLERGVIDAAEWIGPYHDYKMGFYNVAKYYYYPGWHEPGPILEMIVNKQQFEALPLDLQEIIRSAIARLSVWTLGEFEAQNNLYLQKLVKEEGVQLRKFPAEVLKNLKKNAQEVIEEMVSQDPQAKKIYESYQKFRNDIEAWAAISEKVYYETM